MIDRIKRLEKRMEDLETEVKEIAPLKKEVEDLRGLLDVQEHSVSSEITKRLIHILHTEGPEASLKASRALTLEHNRRRRREQKLRKERANRKSKESEHAEDHKTSD